MNYAYKRIFLGMISGLVIMALLPKQTSAQQFHRIKSEYSVKYTDTKGNQILQLGVVFYDLNSKILVMKNGFPVRENLVQKDTTIYQIRNDILVGTGRAYAMVELSIFHLALTGELNNYGLDKTGYHLENVKSDKGLILTTWAPPEAVKETYGKILVSTKDKQLFGIVFLDKNDKIIAKHFYRDYKNINGFVFPSEILRMTYENDQETYKLTRYSKISVNGSGDEEYYNYKIPTN